MLVRLPASLHVSKTDSPSSSQGLVPAVQWPASREGESKHKAIAQFRCQIKELLLCVWVLKEHGELRDQITLPPAAVLVRADVPSQTQRRDHTSESGLKRKDRFIFHAFSAGFPCVLGMLEGHPILGAGAAVDETTLSISNDLTNSTGIVVKGKQRRAS
jgi:hypothetical protein